MKGEKKMRFEWQETEWETKSPPECSVWHGRSVETKVKKVGPFEFYLAAFEETIGFGLDIILHHPEEEMCLYTSDEFGDLETIYCDTMEEVDKKVEEFLAGLNPSTEKE